LGYDLITSKILRELPIIDKISHPVIQRSLAQRVLSGSMESYTDHPRLEAGESPNELTSYQPISFLTTVSKVFVKLLLKRLLPIVENNCTIGHIDSYEG
jgi:hypothetical protein